MIQNDHQLQVTKKAIDKLKNHLEADKVNPPPANIIVQFVKLIGIQTQSLIDQLEKEVSDYLESKKS